LVGLGLDLIEIETVARALRRDPDCAAAWLSARELGELTQQGSEVGRIAQRVVAKEAVSKSLGTGLAGTVAWQDIEIFSIDQRVPIVMLSGGAAEAAHRHGVTQVLVSIAHTRTAVAASAIALGDTV